MKDKMSPASIAMTVLALLLGLLSIAAGAAKVTLVPEEAEFLSQFGFADPLTISFGLVQVLGGLMLIVPRTRIYGALIVAAGFALSAGLILSVGNWTFGAMSLVPPLLAVFVAYRCFVGRQPLEPGRDDT